MEQLAFRAMGSHMLAILDRDGPDAAARLAAVPVWFEAWEQALSRFRPDSELSRLNRAAGQTQPVSPVFGAVLRAALRAARRTGGLITPTLLTALEAAGYDRSFDDLPAGDRPARAPAPADPQAWRGIVYAPRPRVVHVPPAVRLDFGGIAKGWAANQAAARLAAAGPALVDAGGDIAVSGPRRDRQAWPIGVADPRAPNQDLLMLAIRRGGVATSGRDYRRWQQGGLWRHHILDPRTAQPALTDVISATVVGPTAEAAEVAAKAALILGSREGLAWIEVRPELAALLVLDNDRVVTSRRFSRYVWR